LKPELVKGKIIPEYN